MSQIAGKRCLDPVRLCDRKPKIFPQLGRTVRTIKIEHRLAAAAYHMDVRRTMIVRIDDHSQRTDPGYGGHYIKTQTAWVYGVLAKLFVSLSRVPLAARRH